MSPLDDEPEDDPHKHVTEDSANIPPGIIFSVCRISGQYGTFEQKCSLTCAMYFVELDVDLKL